MVIFAKQDFSFCFLEVVVKLVGIKQRTENKHLRNASSSTKVCSIVEQGFIKRLC